MRIGAVNYLNSKPLVCGLDELEPEVRLSYDLPSRLADSLAAGRLDVALIPCVEYFRSPRYRIVSDACLACRGPVLSVKLLLRVPPQEVRRLALDEGSRTSAALSQILLAELHGMRPQLESLPIGSSIESTDADAVLLIGDRAITAAPAKPRSTIGNPQSIQAVWDLGEVWSRWTRLPFVFAMWIARDGVDLGEVSAILAEARDRGLSTLPDIAEREAAALHIPPELATGYLCDNLHFTLGTKERAGLRRFYELCLKHQLAPAGLERQIDDQITDGCATK